MKITEITIRYVHANHESMGTIDEVQAFESSLRDDVDANGMMHTMVKVVRAETYTVPPAVARDPKDEDDEDGWDLWRAIAEKQLKRKL